jgi:hypothetical protein
MTQYAHGENAMLVKASQPTQIDDSPVRHTDNVSQAPTHIDESNMTQVFTIIFIH